MSSTAGRHQTPCPRDEGPRDSIGAGARLSGAVAYVGKAVRFAVATARREGCLKLLGRSIRYLATRFIATQNDLVLVAHCTLDADQRDEVHCQVSAESTRKRRAIDEYISAIENPVTAAHYAAHVSQGDLLVGVRLKVTMIPLACVLVHPAVQAPPELMPASGAGAYVYD